MLRDVHTMTKSPATHSSEGILIIKQCRTINLGYSKPPSWWQFAIASVRNKCRFFNLMLPCFPTTFQTVPMSACISSSLTPELCAGGRSSLPSTVPVQGSNHHLSTDNSHIHISSPYFLLSSRSINTTACLTILR